MYAKKCKHKHTYCNVIQYCLPNRSAELYSKLQISMSLLEVRTSEEHTFKGKTQQRRIPRVAIRQLFKMKDPK